MKEILGGCLAVLLSFVVFGVMVIAILAVAAGGSAASAGIQWFTAPFRGAISAREKIQADPNFRLNAYDSFYNQCASIQGLEKDIDSNLALVGNKGLSENSRVIAASNIVGVESSRDGAIARYNTESHKQWTVAQFKSTALVYELPTAPYATFDNDSQSWKVGSHTVCVVN